MKRSATSRLKFNPPLGRSPVLQFVPPAELQVDATYQRSLDASASQSLIRKIAQHWNWDLCQPLVVSWRGNGDLFVIDGQHRLESARMRGDIAQLPCVVVDYADPADEAASFVHLNQQRRPLSKIDVFKAALASEDGEACEIAAALANAGLSIAPHSNYTAWKPGMVSNIGGIQAAWRSSGAAVTRRALAVLAESFPGQVLRYAGTIFPGIAALVADEGQRRFDPERMRKLVLLVASHGQEAWRREIMRTKGDYPDLKFATASARALRDAWRSTFGTATPPAPDAVPKAALRADLRPDGRGMVWCDQCDMRVTLEQAAGCRSRYCSLKVKA